MIPKISLKDLESNNKSTITLLSDALSNHGFFVITDHDIPFTLFNKSYEYSEKFFNLETSIKNKYSLENMLVLEVTLLLERRQLLVKQFQT
jgi:isopenicillin N synthase-like dioxygenase